MKKKSDVAQVEKAEEPKKKGIVIAETEDDVVLGGIKGDPDDFKEEVKKEAEKGKFFRTIAPILVFLLLGALVTYGTMYYKNQSETQSPKKTEDKIQTPPTVEGDDAIVVPTTPTAPTTVPTTPTTSATADYTVYRVASGDTLSAIANDHNMTSTELAKYNDISVETVLQIGQKLKIPNK